MPDHMRARPGSKQELVRVAVRMNGGEGFFTCNVVNALRLHRRLGQRVRLVGLAVPRPEAKWMQPEL